MEAAVKDNCITQQREKDVSATSTTATSGSRERKFSSVKSKFAADPKLDPVWLYNTLRKEISRETSYDLENDAKLRAVTQGTMDYEQFRQMVLGAHIKPLAKRDKVEGCQNGKRPNVVWNTITSTGRTGSTNSTSSTVVKEKDVVGDDDGQKGIKTETVFISSPNKN